MPVLATLVENARTDERQNALATLGDIEGEGADAVLCTWLDRLAAGESPGELDLDILEAAAGRPGRGIADRLERFEAARSKDDPLASWRETLHGGKVSTGRRIFFENEVTHCARCHTVGSRGGEAGPRLDGIGAQSREYLLAALITPGGDIAAGFATVVLTTADGTVHAGIVKSEDQKTVELIDPNGELTTVAVADIVQRTESGSSMPPVEALLTKREVRDLIAFLASLKPSKR